MAPCPPLRVIPIGSARGRPGHPPPAVLDGGVACLAPATLRAAALCLGQPLLISRPAGAPSVRVDGTSPTVGPPAPAQGNGTLRAEPLPPPRAVVVTAWPSAAVPPDAVALDEHSVTTLGVSAAELRAASAAGAAAAGGGGGVAAGASPRARRSPASAARSGRRRSSAASAATPPRASSGPSKAGGGGGGGGTPTAAATAAATAVVPPARVSVSPSITVADAAAVTLAVTGWPVPRPDWTPAFAVAAAVTALSAAPTVAVALRSRLAGRLLLPGMALGPWCHRGVDVGLEVAATSVADAAGGVPLAINGDGQAEGSALVAARVTSTTRLLFVTAEAAAGAARRTTPAAAAGRGWLTLDQLGGIDAAAAAIRAHLTFAGVVAAAASAEAGAPTAP